MSKQKNVHPDHYKTGGSGRQGEDVVQKKHRERLAREKAELERDQREQQTRPTQPGERQKGEDDRRPAGDERD